MLGAMIKHRIFIALALALVVAAAGPAAAQLRLPFLGKKDAEVAQNAYDLADLLARLFEMVHLDPVPFQFLEMNPFDIHTHAPNRAAW